MMVPGMVARWLLVVAVLGARSQLVAGSTKLRISKVEVPPWVKSGGSADLKCFWEPQNDRMWALRWYQGLDEIYRYTPSREKPVQVFGNTHLLVDETRSTRGHVHIANVSLGASGLFRCEISAEGPDFKTVYQEKEVKVVTLPEGGPQFAGVLERYQEGEWVDLTCHTAPAYPSPHLKLYINGKEPRPGHVEPHMSFTKNADGLESSSLRLRFVLRYHQLADHGGGRDEARVRCVASIPNIGWEESAVVVLSSRPRYEAAGMGGRTSSASYFRDSYPLENWSLLVVSALVAGKIVPAAHR